MKTRMSEKGNRILYVVLSLLLAVIFWLYVDNAMGNTTTVSFDNVPVEFIGEVDTLPSRGLMLSDGGNTTLRLRLSGPRSVISGLRAEDIRVQVNLTSINAVGTYTLPYTLVTPDNVERSSINQEWASRTAITVQVTSLYTREVPVTWAPVGKEADGYLFMQDRVVAEPSVLTLSGLKEDVDEVASARVEVDITGATGTIQQRYSYELLDAQGNVIEDPQVRASEQQVEMTVPVFVMKEVPLTVRYKESAGSRKENTRCTLEHDTITLAGEPVSLETINEIVLGEVDLSAYFSDQTLSFDIKLPAGCENLSGYTTTALEIEYLGLETRSFTVTNIQAIGLSERQWFDPVTSAVDVVLRGPAEDLDLVTEEDIRIVVNLEENTSYDSTIRPQGTVLVDGYSEVGAVGGPYIITGKLSRR